MRVKVNRTEIDIFEGARSRDAVLRYLVHRRLSKSLIDRGSVLDAWGHGIGLDAPLHEGQTIKFKIK